MSDILEVFCLLIDQNKKSNSTLFPVHCRSTTSVGHLKDKVKEKNGYALQNVDAPGLTVWRCKRDMSNVNIHALGQV